MGKKRHKEQAVDTVGEYLTYTTAVLAIGLVLGVFVFAAHPTLDLQVKNWFEKPPEFSGDKIVFADSQVEEMNKMYEERLEEYAWCLEIEGEIVESLRHPLRVHNSSETHVVTQCPASFNGHLHTHPGSLSEPELSRTDKLTLLQGFEVMCVLADPVPDYETQNPVGLNCFENPHSPGQFDSREKAEEALNETEFEQVQVRISR